MLNDLVDVDVSTIFTLLEAMVSNRKSHVVV